MKKLIISIALGFSIILALFLPGFKNDSTLIIGGSTSVYPLFDKLNDLNKSDKAKYYYNILGSRAGFLGVQSESLIVGFMSKNSPNLPNEMKSFALASEGIIFVYHLPASCTTKERNVNFKKSELTQIFLAKKAKWSLFKNLKCQKNEKVFRINREQGSGTRSVFEKKLKLENRQNNYFFEHLSKHSGSTLKIVLQTPGSLAYMSFSYKQKIDSIHQNKKLVNFAKINNFLPNKTNFNNGKYEFLRPFIGLYLTKNKSKLKPFFQFLATVAAKKKFDELGLIHQFNLTDLGN